MLDKLLGVLIQYLTQYVRLYSVFTSGLSDANYEDVGGDEITGWCDGDGDDDGVDGDGDGDGSVITLTAGWCRHEEERAELNSYISFDDYNDSHDDDYNDNHDLIVMMLMIVNVHVMMM